MEIDWCPKLVHAHEAFELRQQGGIGMDEHAVLMLEQGAVGNQSSFAGEEGSGDGSGGETRHICCQETLQDSGYVCQRPV